MIIGAIVLSTGGDGERGEFLFCNARESIEDFNLHLSVSGVATAAFVAHGLGVLMKMKLCEFVGRW